MGLLNVSQQNYYSGNNHGNYQFTSLDNVITQFMIAYVGEGKIISKVKRSDVAFHAQRALAELSFDTFKSCKAQEITVPATLQMILPQDYVNYTKISWVDSAGIKHLLYPTSKTSNPKPLLQEDNGDIITNSFKAVGALVDGSASVELDAEYKNITVGMEVSGPYIPTGTTVATVSNTSGITTITMEDSDEIAVKPLIPGTTTNIGNTGTTLTFTGTVYSKESSHIVDNLSWGIGDATFNFKITGTASELTNIEVGMLVFHNNFPSGTTVTNIYDTTIVVSSTPDNTTAVTSQEVTFISPDLQDSTTWSNYKSTTPSENNNDDYEDDTYWPANGERYGLDPQHAQANGSFYIDCVSGKIHFSSNMSGKTVILDYISDSLGEDPEMQVHKFAEEAIYKWIAYAVLSTRANTQEYIVQRFKKERFAETRKAKLRLSNIKLEEITQILRGKSKQIKH